MIWLLVLAATGDGGTVCVPPAPDAAVKVKFKAGATLEDLARFASTTLCEPWRASEKVARRPLKMVIDGEVQGRQVRGLISMLGEAAGAAQFRGTVVLVDPDELPVAPLLVPLRPSHCLDGADLNAAIIAVDPWTRELKPMVRDALADANCLATEARLVPSFKDGKSQGFKLFAIRPGSLYELLGFKNGDVVSAVNELQLNSPDKALEAYSKLRTATELRFAIERFGEARTISWKFK